MKRSTGPILFLLTSVLCVALTEFTLGLFLPVPDPYAKLKRSIKTINQVIRSEFQRNYVLHTQPEEGLPGVRPHNVFTTNNMGYRGDYLHTPKPTNEFRIFMVGGSTTECLYLDDSDSINTVLQNELQTHLPKSLNIKVYNAGKSGDATPEHISMIAHRIIHLEPDMIILFSGINDLSRSIVNYDYLHYVETTPNSKYTLLRFLATEFQIPRRMYYVLKHIAPTERQILEVITGKTNFHPKIELRKSVPISKSRPRTDVATYARNLVTIVGLGKAHEIQLVFITQASTWNSSIDSEAKNWHWMLYRRGVTYREEFMNEALEAMNDAMRQVAIQHRVPRYDLSILIPKSVKYFYDDAHFNVEGAKWAGEGLASYIVAKNLILF